MSLVLVERPAPHVTLLMLNRPEARNALNPALRAELRDHFLALAADPECRAIIVTGDERAFAAGADIKAMATTSAADMMARDDEANWAAISACPKPVIAAVRGYALGGGCELAMQADIIIAGQGAVFGQPEVRLGIMPGAGGTQRLSRAIGKHRALLMLLTAATLSGEEAFAAGLVSKVVADNQVVPEALAIAIAIAGMPPLAVAEIKRVVLAGLDTTLTAALMLERRAAYLLFDTKDKQEAMNAFIEKRQGRYTSS